MISSNRIKVQLAVLITLAAGSPALAAANIKPADPPQGVFFERYYALMLGSIKCGYSLSRFERRGNKIHHHNSTTIKIARAAIPIQITQELTTVETIDGKPLRFKTSTLGAGQNVKVRGRIANGKVHATTYQAGRKTEKTYPLPAGALMPWAEHILSLKHGLASGTQYEVKSYNPLAGPATAVTGKVKVIGPEVVSLLGKKVRAIKIVSSITMAGMTINSDAWVDNDSQMLISTTSLGPFTMKIIACAKPVALSNYSPVEIFNTMAIPLTQPANINSAKSVQYRISRKNTSSPMPALPQTGMQQVLARQSLSVTIQVQPGGSDNLAKSPAKGGKKARARKLKKYLKSNTYLDLSDPALIKLAKQTAANITDKLKLAERLRRCVSEKIKTKNFNVGFATASETVRSGEGDCSEHAVLLAALARILKIPARAIMGLVYSPDHNSFVYHMWTELWIDHRWVGLDAALDQNPPDASHIALTTSSLNDEQFIEEIFKLIDLIGQIKIDVVNVKN